LLLASGSSFNTSGAVVSTYAKEVTHSVSLSELESEELLLEEELFFDLVFFADLEELDPDELLELLDDDELLFRL